MLYSIKGKILLVEEKFLVVENCGLGYKITVPNPSKFSVNEDVFLYLYHDITENGERLVGFTSKEEMDTFKLLIHVSHIGPVIATSILSNVTYNDLFVAISNDDFDFIKSIPGVNAKLASQILLDLKGYISRENKKNTDRYHQIKAALKAFKFKSKEIDEVLPGIYIPNGTDQEILKEALRRLNNAKNFR